jgi:glycine cleavage system H protein
VAPSLGWLSGGFASVSFKQAGSTISKGAGIGWVEGPRHFDVVRAPFDCVLVAGNSDLPSNPRLLNKDPYGAGWFALVEPRGGDSSFMGLAEAAESIAARLKELGVHCFSEFPDEELFEIGVECSAVIVSLNELLSRSKSGTVVHVVSDDPTSDIEMERWVDETGNLLLESRREGAIFHFVVKKS